MTSSGTVRDTRTFPDRPRALSHFFLRAEEAPRVVAYDDELGCPLTHVLAALEWTTTVGVLHEEDVIHAARLGGETAAAVVERRRDGRRIYVYLGPRMDAPPAEPYEGTLLYDEPGVRAYEFSRRPHALAHFLRATLGAGAVWTTLTRRGPEVRHVRRWLAALFEEPGLRGSPQLLAAWFATGGAGLLFLPAAAGEPWVYEEVTLEAG